MRTWITVGVLATGTVFGGQVARAHPGLEDESAGAAGLPGTVEFRSIRPEVPTGDQPVAPSADEPKQQAVVAVPVTPDRQMAPKVEVAFVLDTTGSMAGLIEGAKRKIWSIANRIASARPTPEIRMAIIGYRDRGDAYVTQVHDLTEDIDKVHATLKELRADGGGDTPEHVNRALADALHKLSWSPGTGVLRQVFLVGDAPPHDDYDDTPGHQALAREASRNGILINTIRCGQHPETGQAWQRIAGLAGGEFLSIAQDGGMAIVTTPLDAELAKLNAELASTAMAFGSHEKRHALRAKMDSAATLPAPAAAERASWASKAGGRAVYGEADLVTAVESGGTRLETLADEELPDLLRGKTSGEMKEALEEVKDHRRQLVEKIEQVSKERAAYLEGQVSTRRADGFDRKVEDLVTRQSRSIGLTFDGAGR